MLVVGSFFSEEALSETISSFHGSASDLLGEERAVPGEALPLLPVPTATLGHCRPTRRPHAHGAGEVSRRLKSLIPFILFDQVRLFFMLVRSSKHSSPPQELFQLFKVL